MTVKSADTTESMANPCTALNQAKQMKRIQLLEEASQERGTDTRVTHDVDLNARNMVSNPPITTLSYLAQVPLCLG